MSEHEILMDENFTHPDDDFDDIEDILKNLQPTELKPDLLRELQRDQRNIAARHQRESGKIIFARFVPLAVAACLVLAGYLAFQLGFFEKTSQVKVTEGNPINQPRPVAPEDEHLLHGLPPLGESGQFRPVSAQGIVTDASVGRFVPDSETGAIMREETLTVWDVFIYVDPETGTRIRQFVPRDVTTLKPVIAD